MTPEQKEYYARKLREIRSPGDMHEAFVINHISGMGSYNLGPVDPPVIGFGQDNDPHYTQYFQNWDEINTLIRQIESEATKAWGPRP